MLGFLEWARLVSTNSYVKVWAFVGVLAVGFYLIAFYIGGRLGMRERRQKEKEAQKRREEVAMTRRQMDERENMFRF